MEDFAKKYGSLKPSQFVDIVALVGDQSDNIPGHIALLVTAYSSKIKLVMSASF